MKSLENRIQLKALDRKRRVVEVILQAANKDPNYDKIIEIVDQRLNDKRSLLVAALIAILNTLKTNPYGFLTK